MTSEESLERVAISADRRILKMICFKTKSSYWEVNTLEHLVRRSPLVPDAVHSGLGYVEDWEPAVLEGDIRLGEAVSFHSYQSVFALFSGSVVSIESIQFV